MRYEMMFPDQIREAIDRQWPVVLPLGVLEYHAEHCVVGVDALLVMRALEVLEQEMPLVILPPFNYGSASYVVAPPERRGTVQIDCGVLHPLARALFGSLLRIGFRNIHAVIHHQSENFAAGMPTDLAFKFAARRAIFDFLASDRGENWWGDEAARDYYDAHEGGDNPFNWIQLHPLMDEEAQRRFPIDHAGLQETSLMLALCPEGVDMQRHTPEAWYAEKAPEANERIGHEAREMILAGLRRALGKA